VVTYAFINVGPNPCGVGQSVTVDFWVDIPPPNSPTNVYTNMTVLVTLPDGTSTTLGPFISDDTGGTTTQYVPEQTGNYTFQFNYGGQTLSAGGAYGGDYMEPST